MSYHGKELTLTLKNRATVIHPKGGERFEDFIPENLRFSGQFPLVGITMNNQTHSLMHRVDTNGELGMVYLNDRAGLNIYRQSLTFLTEMAFHNLYPKGDLVIDHSLGNGFYYHLEGENPQSAEAIPRLRREMERLVEENFPIDLSHLNYVETMEMIKARGGAEKTLTLMEGLNKPRIMILNCDGYRTIFHGPLVPRTGLLTQWEIQEYDDGFLLRFPPSRTPLTMAPFKDEPKLFSIYQEHKKWGKILDVHCVGQLNALAMDRKKREHFILTAETLHSQKMSDIAHDIHDRGKVKLVLVAGPSSSGKTTFTKRMAINLQTLGYNPVMVSLDDYYLPREQVPKDEEGEIDFEALEALDVPLLNQNLLDLFAGKEAEIPIFNFKKGGRQDKGRLLKLEENTLLIMEGIHGLNEKLTGKIPAELKYKIYISALTQLNLDDNNRISTTDNRMIRRIVRDYQFRGYTAHTTIGMWPSVRRGEQKNIFPYQGEADVIFNSALDYELGVLKGLAEPLLKSVKPTEEEYSEACRLLSFLNYFAPIPSEDIPKLSLLREFVGNSGFRY
ncbi:MAG: nucleoside kinase [Spirochaetales bacterium]|nr:nucleoside kinase [Spirochaetales bacterium]